MVVWNKSCYFDNRNQGHKIMTTLTLTPIASQKGLGCLNGLSCPVCNAPLVDTLSGLSTSETIKDSYCPMCDFAGHYNINTKKFKQVEEL